MKITWSLKLMAAFFLFSAVMVGCKKSEKVVTPPSVAHFANQSSGTYFVTGPNVVYKIPIGTTTVSGQPRTLRISATSPTGATEGTHYTFASKTITLQPGKAVDSIEVRGVFSEYTTGRIDTLIIKIEDQDVPSSSYNSSFTLVMRGPCFEGDVVLDDFLGTYANTNEDWGGSPYGPYTTMISAVNQTSATTGTITVTNIFDAGWNPLTFTLDWTDPNNRRITLVAQNAGGNAGASFGAAYNGMNYGVRPVPASAGGHVGTFSICNQTLTLKMQIGVWGVGYASDIYTVNMAR